MTNNEKETITLQVKKKEAERIRKLLVKKKALDSDFLVTLDENYVYFPLLKDITLENYKLVKRNMIVRKKQLSLEEYLEIRIPENLSEYIPSSIDYIGKDVAILKLDPKIMKFKNIIGEGILQVNKVQSVYLKIKDIEGVYRIANYELIAGIEQKYPVHLEHGIKIQVDLHNAYFNPRLGNEHQRVANLVLPNEVIIDMFSGVGPFALHIAKKNQVKIYAIDINPSAIKCLEKSIDMQKMVGEIIPLNGDVNEVLSDIPEADRVIMNLPGTASDFLKVAFDKTKKSGTIHFYQFIIADNEKDSIKKAEYLIKSVLAPEEKYILKDLIKFRDISPHKFKIRVDIKKK